MVLNVKTHGSEILHTFANTNVADEIWVLPFGDVH